MEERKTRRLLFVLAVVVVLAVAPTAGPAGAKVEANYPVTVRNNVFDPATRTINPGDTVTWTNIEGDHNVKFVDGLFEMPANTEFPPWMVSRTFSNPGSYAYYCELHGSAQGVGMAGTVIVNAAAPPPPPPPPGGSPPPGGGSPGGGSPGGGSPGPGGDPSPGSPSGGKLSIKVTLRVSDPTPAQGGQVRFFGSVRPEQDGRLLRLQRRTRAGSYRTIKKLKLRDAGTSRSKFTGTLRVAADAAFRARLPADSAHEPGTSRTRRLNVH
jgi:plastocyanin